MAPRRWTNDPTDEEGYNTIYNVSSFAYTYYPDGNVQSVSDTRNTTSYVTNYSYDSANRLTSTIITNGDALVRSWAYVYNNRGDRTSQTVTDADNVATGTIWGRTFFGIILLNYILGTIWGRTFFGIILLNYILKYRFVYVPNWPSSEGFTSSYTMAYNHNEKTHELSRIERDDVCIYYTNFGTYGLQTNEYSLYGTSEYRGVENTISNGNITKKEYALLTSSTDSSSTVKETTTYTYDEYGNVASMDGEGVYVEYTYEYGDYSGDTDPEYSIIITETYPDAANITDSQGADIPSADVSNVTYYDKWGNLVKSVDGEGNTTAYTYDYLGRVLTVKHPDNTTQKYSYNDTANRIYITDENGKWTMIKYDGLGRELGLYHANETGASWVITYYKSYDSHGNLMGYSPYRDGVADCTTKYTYYTDNSVKTERLRNRLSGDILMENIYSYSIPEDNLNAVSVTRKKTDSETVVITNYTNQYGYKVKDTISGDDTEYTQGYTVDAGGNITEVYDLNGNKAHKYTYDYRSRIKKDTYPIGSTTNVYDGALLYQVKDSSSEYHLGTYHLGTYHLGSVPFGDVHFLVSFY